MKYGDSKLFFDVFIYKEMFERKNENRKAKALLKRDCESCHKTFRVKSNQGRLCKICKEALDAVSFLNIDS